MYKPKYNPQRYYSLIHKNLETQLFLSAIRLDIFSHLADWASPANVALRTGYNERSLSLYLNALAAVGLLDKQGNSYRSTAESNEFLNKNSPVYLGECILFRVRMMALDKVEERIKHGPDPKILSRNQGVEVYDFYEAARSCVPEMYTGRVQALLKAVQRIFKEGPPKKFLDLGGGSGIMGMELASLYPDCRGVIFEHPSVADFPRELLLKRGFGDRITVMSGDFNVDDIGSDYDLIIASGVIDFAKDYLDSLINKLNHSLTPTGYLYLGSHNVSEDYQTPKESILGWLSSHLEGLDILLTRKTIESALSRHGFRPVQAGDIEGAFAHLQGRFYSKLEKDEKDE